MLKTVLKTIALILILSGVFFGALLLWQKYQAKNAPVAPVETPAPVAPVVLKQIQVTPSQDGAMIQMSEVPGPNYTVSPTAQSNVIEVTIPGSQSTVATPTMAKPDPLVDLIEVSSAASQVKVRITLVEGATYRDRLVGSTLVIDVMGKVAPTVTPTPEATVTPTPKPKAASKAPVTKKAKPVAKKKVVKAPVKKKQSKPALHDLEPLPAPMDMGSEPVVAQPLFTPEPMGTPEAVAPEPTAVPAGKPGELDLEKLFSQSKADEVPPEEPAAPSGTTMKEPTPEETRVAAVQPSNQTFDRSQVMKNLPAISAIFVDNQGGVPSVSIQREGKIKWQILKQRNPSRVVVEFQNARNSLLPEYSGPAGSRLVKVTTKMFQGADATITRITLFVLGEPTYQAESQGENVIVKLP